MDIAAGTRRLNFYPLIPVSSRRPSLMAALTPGAACHESNPYRSPAAG